MSRTVSLLGVTPDSGGWPGLPVGSNFVAAEAETGWHDLQHPEKGQKEMP